MSARTSYNFKASPELASFTEISAEERGIKVAPYIRWAVALYCKTVESGIDIDRAKLRINNHLYPVPSLDRDSGEPLLQSIQTTLTEEERTRLAKHAEHEEKDVAEVARESLRLANFVMSHMSEDPEIGVVPTFEQGGKLYDIAA